MSSELSEPMSVVDYVTEHIAGLVLLLVAGVIVYVVDHINRLNAILFSPPMPVPPPVKKKR